MNRAELENHILQTYGVKAEYPWAKFPHYAVFRHKHNRKWFAVIMDLPKEKPGIEEEGIPYDLAGVPDSDVYEIGFKAAKASRLGVGIGVSSNKLILHFEKLEKKRPIFEIGTFEKENYRILGSNAARLVKKMPFKDFE